MTPILYHFTSIHALRSILDDGRIKRGLIFDSHNRPVRAICLTLADKPENLGLSEPGFFSIDEFDQYPIGFIYTERDGRPYRVDGTQVRIKIPINASHKVIPAMQLYAHDLNHLLILFLTAIDPNLSPRTKEDIEELIHKHQEQIGMMLCDWHYSLDDIPLNESIEIDINFGNGFAPIQEEPARIEALWSKLPQLRKSLNT